LIWCNQCAVFDGHQQMIECPLLEGQQTRLRFLNDGNLDPVHQRNVSAAQPLQIGCEPR